MRRFLMVPFICFVLSLFSTNGYTQPRNTIVFDTAVKKDILFGYCDRDGLTGELFEDQFRTQYEEYFPEPGMIDEIKNLKPDYEISIVFATWCKDSRRELPRFFKILDKIEFDEEKLTLIGVDRSKKAGAINLDYFKIERVPTFIFTKGGMEIGRITEIPETNLEVDFYHILMQSKGR